MASLTLGAARTFAVLGATTVTNTGPSSIVGDVGVAPGNSITGFPPGTVTGGTIHLADAIATQAHADATTAYNVLAGEVPNTDLTGQDLGGLTLAPGVYHFSGAATLTGTLTLDAQGNPDARFDFQIASTLTTAAGSAIKVINGGQDGNIFFQVGSSATLGTSTAFEGNILALTSITATTGASLNHGRALALNGAVTLDTNIASVPTNTAPGFTSLDPTSKPEGTPSFVLRLNGTGFVPDSVAQLNGASLATTFVSSTQLQATIPAADMGEEGTAAITVFTPGPGGGTTFPQTFTITDPAVVATGGSNFTAPLGTPTGNVTVATFTDPGGSEPNGFDPNPPTVSGHYTATINWGDGTPNSAGVITFNAVPGNFTVSGNHTYTKPGNSVITVTINHENAPPVTVTDTTNTPDSRLFLTAFTVTATEGAPTPANLVVAGFTDADGPDPVGQYVASIDWGDGTTSTGNIVASGSNFQIQAPSHVYAEEGNYTVGVTLTDNDPTTGAGPVTVFASNDADVADAALSLPAAQPTVNATERATFTAPVASFNDSNPGATLSDFAATIDWGDGSPQSAGTISQPGGPGTVFLVTGTHTFDDSGVNGGVGLLPISVTVADKGGSRLFLTNNLNVADVAIALTGQLNPASDSGQSSTDAITNVNQPNFFGTSEPFSHVSLFATPTTGGTPVLIGQTTAGADGTWSITSIRLLDGSYTITGTATDQSGKTTTGFSVPATSVQFLPNPSQGPLVIDTVGPRVANVFFNRLNGEVDVVYQDDRSGLNKATILDSANYELTRPHRRPGTFLLTNINTSPNGNPTARQNVALVFNGGRALRGGLYTFTIRDSTRGRSSVQDVAGNSLDGEFYGNFPSGNGVPGGDFVAMLDSIHNKVFAPQTLVGTANAANNGQGGLPVGSLHGGRFTRVLPRGAGPFFGNNGVAVAASRRHHVSQTSVVVHHPQGPRRHA